MTGVISRMSNKEIEEQLIEIINSPKNVVNPPFWVNPINATEERGKFISAVERGVTYNPRFEYSALTYKPSDYVAKIEDIKIDDSTAWGAILERTRQYLIDKLLMIAARGSHAFSTLSQKTYGSPDEKLIKRAKELLAPPPAKPEKERFLWPEEVVTQLNQVLREMKLDWVARLREQVALAEVSTSDRTLWVDASPTTPFTKEVVNILNVHEIKSHIQRHENGRQSGHPLFALGTGYYLRTEEGLAFYNEHYSDMEQTRANKYAMRVLAVNAALEHSFMETFQELKKINDEKKVGLKSQELVGLAERSKRGLEDTSQPGAFTKDIVYLAGFDEIHDYVENEGQIEDLLVGKISVQDARALKAAGELGSVPPADTGA